MGICCMCKKPPPSTYWHRCTHLFRSNNATICCVEMPNILPDLAFVDVNRNYVYMWRWQIFGLGKLKVRLAFSPKLEDQHIHTDKWIRNPQQADLWMDKKKGTLRRKKHKDSWCWRTEQHFSKYGLPASGNICIILGAAPGHDVSGYLPQLEPTSIRWYANQYLKCQIRRLVLWNRFIAGTTTFFSCSTEFLFQSLTAWS